ncbi:hypothetical protein TRIP_D270004 [uncultured Paludibacter sp.]|nr:hypothetical protein TRIP_D270004 [uncultured Paludibacter sp.]
MLSAVIRLLEFMIRIKNSITHQNNKYTDFLIENSNKSTLQERAGHP